MHILLIHQAFAALDEAGGTRHIEMARRLAASGHQITIVASPVSYLTGSANRRRIPWVERTRLEDGITLIRTYTLPALHKGFAARVISFFSFMVSSLWAALGVRQVDIVWGTTPPIFQAATAWLTARIKKARFLLEVRDLWPAFAIAVGALRSPLLIRLSEWLERFLYRHADRIIVNSPGFIEHIEARGGKEIDLVPNGVDTAMFETADGGAAFREAHGLEDRFVVLYAGAHGPSNDLDVLLEAADRLRELPEVCFLLVGDGKEKARLMEKAAQLHLQSVVFLPPVAKQDMAGVTAAADAGVAILKPIEMYKTTYPNKVFDYMAAGKPVLLAIDGVIRRLVEKAGAGIFCVPGDAQVLAEGVRRLYNDRETAKAMGAAGKRYVQLNYDRAKITAQLEAIFLQLAGKR